MHLSPRIYRIVAGKAKCFRCAFLALAVCTLAPTFAAAQTVALNVVNPGFEDITGQSPSNEFTFGPLNGWELYDPNTITNGGAGGTFYIGTLTPSASNPAEPGVVQFFPGGAIEGNRVGIAFNFAGSDGLGEYGMVQTLADTLQPNTQYNLTVQIGNIASGVAQSSSFFNLAGFPGYRVDLLAGNQILNSDNNSLAGSIPDGQWGLSTLTFATGQASPFLDQPLSIRLVNLNQQDTTDPTTAAADLEVDFDDIQLSATALPPGDINLDAYVDANDLDILFNNWGALAPSAPDPDIPLGTPRALGDVTGDFAIDHADLNLVLRNWTAGPAPALNIPEPTTASLLASTGMLMLRRRRAQ